MKVKMFDEAHEKDLENSLNVFLSSVEGDIIDIKFGVTIGISGEEQIYCFSAMVLYN
ncbi:MAG: sporulation protein Cse60 [bacterium]